jgi:hypothetical protein
VNVIHFEQGRIAERPGEAAERQLCPTGCCKPKLLTTDITDFHEAGLNPQLSLLDEGEAGQLEKN